jgi:CHAT domain-containing protein/tetratricopeptide (TPR) repeat protein
MQKRYFFKQNTSLRKYLFFVFLISVAVNAQYNSEEYLSFKNSKTFTTIEKEFKIDSLLKIIREDSISNVLAYDLYDYAIWHYLNKNEEKAIKASNVFVEIIDSLPNFDIKIHKAALNNLGFFYSNKQDYFNAYSTYKKLCILGTADVYTANAYRLAGRNLRLLGDFYLAADYFDNSINIAKEIKDIRMFILNSVDASINYKEIATPESLKKGVEILKEAIALTNNLKKDFSNQPIIISDKDKFMVYNHMGNILNDRDDYNFKESYLNYEQSQTLALKNNDTELLAIVYNDLGYLYLHNQKKEALKYFNKALKQQPDIETSSIIYANISTYYLKLKNYKRSLNNIQQAIHVLSPINASDSQNLPTKEAASICQFKIQLLKSLMGKAEILLDSYKNLNEDKQLLENTLETLKLADYLVDIIRFESGEQQSKLFWRKMALEIYTNAVKTCFNLKKPEEAFYFMEKNKALLLLEDLSLREQRENAKVPESIYNRQFSLRKEILNYTTLLNNTEKKDSVRPLLINAKETYAYFIDSLQKDYKLYYKTQKSAKIITLNEAKKALTKNNKTYVEYSLGSDDGFGMLITKLDTKFFKIKNYDKLLDLSEKFRTLLERPLETKKDLVNYNTVASSLYTILFPKSISEEFANKKLIIIPDSYLQNIPFEALLTSTKPNSYFIKQNEISYAYSISFLHQNEKWKRENSKDFLGFAPVNFNNDLSNLPLSKEEVMVGVSLFSSDSFLYNDATKQNFIQNTKGHKIIHIASHSNVVDNKNPWIVFSDKKLTLNELYLTENTADLVVLSACKTSLGNLNEGEGVMSLARGFFNTGANSVLSTLWNVNDKSSSKIITEFYQEVKKGKTKSEALHDAKLNYLNNHQLSEQSPYYWASFVLIGNHESINFSSKTFPYMKMLFFLSILSIVIYLVGKRKK